MRKLLGNALIGLAVIGGCATTQFNRVEPVSRTATQAVLAEVKRQLSVYTAYQRYRYPSVIASSSTRVCGNGLIGFDITDAKLELLTTTEGTAGGSVAVGATPVAAGVTLGGGASASRVTTDSQTLTFNSEVVLSSKAVDYKVGMLKNAPIAQAMVNLWDAGLGVGNDPSDVCLKVKKAETNTYKISIQIVDDGKGNVAVGLGPASLTANGELKSTTGNTVTVTYAPHDFHKPFPRRPHASAPGDPNGANTLELDPGTKGAAK